MFILVEENSCFLKNFFGSVERLVPGYKNIIINVIIIITVINYCCATFYFLKALKCIIPF